MLIVIVTHVQLCFHSLSKLFDNTAMNIICQEDEALSSIYLDLMINCDVYVTALLRMFDFLIGLKTF